MCETESLTLSWKRPKTLEFPKVWHTFMARDINSANLVEYRIQDLPESKAEDVFKHMLDNYIPEEPIAQALGGVKDPMLFEDYKTAWNVMIEQKTPLVCLKTGSDDIVGVQMNFVINKNDHFMEKLYEQFKSPITKQMFDIVFLMYGNFDTFEHYGVTDYLTSFGLSVDRKYRGRSIGDRFLSIRKSICKEYQLKIAHTVFTSDYSNRNADNAGFVPNVVMKFEDVMKSHPQHEKLKNIKSKQMAIKTLIC